MAKDLGRFLWRSEGQKIYFHRGCGVHLIRIINDGVMKHGTIMTATRNMRVRDRWRQFGAVESSNMLVLLRLRQEAVRVSNLPS